MIMSGASSLGNNNLLRIIFMVGMLIYNMLHRRPVYNNVLFCILSGWLIINVLSSLYLGESILLYQFFGKIVLIYTGYLIIISCGNNFWDKYESFLYKIIIISFVIYILSLLIPSVFNSLSYSFRPFTEDFFYSNKDSQKHYFYSFFFVYLGNDIFRNSGFMWEPGAYAMVLVLLILYNLGRNGIHINKHIKVYFIAILTTFSTAGYLALFVIAILFLIQGKNPYIKALIIICSIVLSSWFINADFLLPKIEKFLDTTERGKVFHQGYRNQYEANRILSIKLLFDKFLLFPLGWGCVTDKTSYLALKNIATVNGLGNILVIWGGIGFTFFMYSIYRFFKRYKQTVLFAVFSLLIIGITFFSNPIENNILFYILVLSPYCYKSKKEPVKRLNPL